MKPEGPVARRGDYQIAICPSKLAADFVRAYHYSKSTSHRALSFCAAKSDGAVAAVVQFLPPLPPAARFVADEAKKRGLDIAPRDVLTLTRLAVAPGEPQNVASMLVGAALRQLRRDKRWKAVVTFADMRQGHTGQVYRALNAEPLGTSKPEPVWIDPSDGSMVSRKSTVSRSSADMRALGYQKEMSPGKYRFVWWLVDARPAVARGQSTPEGKLKFQYEDTYQRDGYYRQPRGVIRAFLGNTYVGEAGFLRYPDSPDQVSLEHVVIEPAFQKRGIGKVLVSEVKRFVNRVAPGVKYLRADFASRASLRMTIAVLGAPMMLDNDIRCVSLAEAEEVLPAVSVTRTRGGRTAVESGAPIGGSFWVGRGKRPAKSPFQC